MAQLTAIAKERAERLGAAQVSPFPEGLYSADQIFRLAEQGVMFAHLGTDDTWVATYREPVEARALWLGYRDGVGPDHYLEWLRRSDVALPARQQAFAPAFDTLLPGDQPPRLPTVEEVRYLLADPGPALAGRNVLCADADSPDTALSVLVLGDRLKVERWNFNEPYDGEILPLRRVA